MITEEEWRKQLAEMQPLERLGANFIRHARRGGGEMRNPIQRGAAVGKCITESDGGRAGAQERSGEAVVAVVEEEREGCAAARAWVRRVLALSAGAGCHCGHQSAV